MYCPDDRQLISLVMTTIVRDFHGRKQKTLA